MPSHRRLLFAVSLSTGLLGALGCGGDKGGGGAETPGPGKASPSQETTPDPGQAPEGQTEPDLGAPAPPPADSEAGSGLPAADKTPPSASNREAGGAAPEALLAAERTAGVFESAGEIALTAFESDKDEPKVAVQILDWTETEKLIASHKGKVVVVDFWSLACEPCRREFPHLVSLHAERSADVACVSVSTDYAGIKSKPPKFYEPKVLDFLKNQGAVFDNVLCSVESEELFDQLGLPSIPAVYVYDKSGELSEKFMGEEVSYTDQVLPAVDRLLGE